MCVEIVPPLPVILFASLDPQEKDGSKKMSTQRHTQHILFTTSDHSDIIMGNPLPPLRRVFFSLTSKRSLICSITQKR